MFPRIRSKGGGGGGGTVVITPASDSDLDINVGTQKEGMGEAARLDYPVVIDSSANARHGTALGTNRPVPVKSFLSGFGNCWAFDGNVGAVRPSIDCGAFSFTGPFTVEMRVRRTRLGVEVFGGKWNDTANSNWILLANSGPILQASVIRADGTQINATISWPSTGNATIAIEYDGTNLYAILEGVRSAPAAVAGGLRTPDATIPVLLGNYAPGTLPAQGWIDEVRMSDIARYSGNYTPSATPFTSDANTVLLYHMDEAALVPDSSANGRDAYFFGTTAPAPIVSPFPGDGTAYLFSATSPAIIPGFSDFGVPATGFTFEARIRHDAVSAADEVIGGVWNLAEHFLLYLQGASSPAQRLFAYIRNAGGSQVFISTPFAIGNGPCEVAMDYDGTTLRLYYNGEMVSSVVTTMNTYTVGQFIIGKLTSAGGLPFVGAIDEVRLSNIARRAGVRYVPFTGPFTSDANTIGLWHLNSTLLTGGVLAGTANPVPTGTESQQAMNPTLDPYVGRLAVTSGNENEAMGQTELGTESINVGTENEASLGTIVGALAAQSLGTENQGTFQASSVLDIIDYTDTAAEVNTTAPLWANVTQAQGAFNGVDADPNTNPPSNCANHPGVTGLQTSMNAILRCSGISGPSTISGFTRTAIKIRVRHRWEIGISAAVAGIKDVFADIELRNSANALLGLLKRRQATGSETVQNPLLTEEFDISSLVSDAQLAAGIKVDFHIYNAGTASALVAALDGTTWYVDGCHLVETYTRSGIT